MPLRDLFAPDGMFWRKLARFGASRGPEWWVRYSPAVFGWAAALAVPSARRAVLGNIRRIRGPQPPLRETAQVLHTFSTYAGCLAEVLSNGSKNAKDAAAIIVGAQHVHRALEAKTGFIFVTAHTAGWEVVGPLLFRDHDVDLMMVMEPERDPRARALHDRARVGNADASKPGLRIAHVGHDPLASLTLLNHLRAGGIVALQIDRVAPGMKTRDVELFGAPGRIPEGPLRLAQLAGAPMLPIFSAREGYRRYFVRIGAPIRLPRHATERDKDEASRAIADAMSAFLSEHPTQWFHFREG